MRYLVNEPQIEEYRRRLGERPPNWTPSPEDAETVRLLQSQIREWGATNWVRTCATKARTTAMGPMAPQ